MEAEVVTNIADLARAEQRVIDHTPDLLTLIIPEGSKEVRVDLEWYQDNPRRKKGRVILRNADGFIDYVKRHRGPETLVLAENQSVVAYINHHAPGVDTPAGWADHVAELELRFTPSWTAWLGFAGKYIPQEEFAFFLEERVKDVAEPAGAVLLEIALNLRAKLEATYEKALVTQNGQVRLTYNESITATGGSREGEMTVPERLTLGLTPFEGGQAFAIPALLRYRIRGGHLEFMIKLGDEALAVFETAFDEMCLSIATRVGTPVLRGRRAS